MPTLVSLGSSFASGPGLPPYADKAAMRSTRNYPHLVAQQLGMEVVDLTIAGATTETVLTGTQRLGRHSFPPQMSGFPQRADVVTLTIGGNDLGYLGEVMVRAVGRRTDRLFLGLPVTAWWRLARPLKDKAGDRAEAGMVRIVDAVRTRAPEARVVLVDYLPVFPAGPTPPPFTDEEVAHFRRLAAELSAAYARAAEQTGALLVPASAYAQDHGLGSEEPYLFGLQGIRDLASSFHPTALGMQAVAEQVVRRLTDSL